MTQALTAATTQQFNLRIEEINKYADMFAKSGLFKDTQSMAQAAVKIMAGQEIGITPFAAMNGINIIMGKVTLGANLQAAKVKASGKYDFKILTHTTEECLIQFYEQGAERGQSLFTMRDASDAGLLGRDMWKKYPRNMLFARAVSNGIKWNCPDVFNGVTVYDPDELYADKAIDITPMATKEPYSVEHKAKIIARLATLGVDSGSVFLHYNHEAVHEFTNEEIDELIIRGKELALKQATVQTQQERLAQELIHGN